MDLPIVVIDVQGLAGAALETIKAGLAAQVSHNDGITKSWIEFAKGYTSVIADGLPPAPDAFAMLSAKYADNMVAGGNYHAAADQLTDIRQLEENKIAITATAGTLVSQAGFEFSRFVRGEIRAANRLQFEITVSTSNAFREEAKKRLGVQDLAQQLNTIGAILERIQGN